MSEAGDVWRGVRVLAPKPGGGMVPGVIVCAWTEPGSLPLFEVSYDRPVGPGYRPFGIWSARALQTEDGKPLLVGSRAADRPDHPARRLITAAVYLAHMAGWFFALFRRGPRAKAAKP